MIQICCKWILSTFFNRCLLLWCVTTDSQISREEVRSSFPRSGSRTLILRQIFTVFSFPVFQGGGGIFLDCNRSLLFFLYIGNFVQFKLAGFRETAFVYAIISAGMAQAIATSCRMGKLASCGCDETIIGEGRGWIWGGCSDNAIYASKFAGRFMDSREKSRDFKSQMNLHNNQAGRLVSELLVMI